MPGHVRVHLAEFGEHADTGGRVEEGDQPAGGAAARTRVEGPKAQCCVAVERDLNVVNPVGHVVQAAPALGKEGCDLGGRARRSEQFNPRFADLEHHRLDAVGFDELPVTGRAPEQPFVGGDGRVEVPHRNADMVDSAHHRREYRNEREAQRSRTRCSPATSGSEIDATFDPTMPRTRLLATVIASAAVVVLAAYATLWASVSQANIGASDYTATYVGGTLLREGHGGSLFDEALQAPLHAALIAPRQGGNLAFVSPPVAAVLAAPLTVLPLSTAYRVWQVAQLLMLAVAVLLAARFAPWPARLRRPMVVGPTVLAALAGTGTLTLGLLAQWDGFSALGLAGAYALWRTDRRFAGGVVLAATSLAAKPHLAVGLAALLLGWRDRRVLAGAVTGAAAATLVSLLAVGPAGLGGFAAALVADGGRWPLASMMGFTGLTGSWLGNGSVAQLIAAVASVAAVAACFRIGVGLAGDRQAVEPRLAAATALSLLASPHLLSHDLVLLAPLLVALIAWASARDAPVSWPGARAAATLAGWVVLSVAAALDIGGEQFGPLGRLVPWALLAAAAVLMWQLKPPALVLTAAAT